MDVRGYLKEHGCLLFDGAMGTYHAGKYREEGRTCEEACLTAPEEIEAIHREYIAAGAAAIKTDTFAANGPALGRERCQAVIRAAYEIACRAAGEDVFVFADIGPIEGKTEAEILEGYLFVADTFLDLGAMHFLFETNSDLAPLPAVAAHIKRRAPESFLIVSFAVQPDGTTRSGQFLADLFPAAARDPHIDAVGLNCVSGARHMRTLLEPLEKAGTIVSAMPNAGYPTVRGNRTFYDGDPAYLADQMAQIRAAGAQILGGCCGTTPEYIAAIRKALEAPVTPKVTYPAQPVKPAPAQIPVVEERFWKALCDPAEKPFAVELDSPADADITKFMAGARQLQDSGASIITIADCPVARARMDASILACKLHRELGVEVLPHMTCRDRNLNATQALLLGLFAEEIRNVLVVTGDPIPSASRDEVKSVYNFNSRKLIRYIDGLGRTMLPAPFRVFGALNPNARNFHIQLELAQEKEANGACGFLTQPILTAQGLENLKQARDTLHGKILGGIIPVVSQKNALFMNSEIAGITVDDKIIALYEGADRAQGEDLATMVSVAVAKEILPYIDGFYLMTPFGRTGLMARIMDAIRKDVLGR